METKLHKVLSAIMTLAVIGVLVFATPAEAVQLSTDAPDAASVGQTVEFDLTTTIAQGENIPLESVTLILQGASGRQLCTFAPDGSPISGCEGLSISLSEDSTQYLAGDRYGAGGQPNVNTSFGYGYGNAAVVSDATLTYTVQWDTTAYKASMYHVSFYVTAEGGDVTRVYSLETADKIKLNKK